MASADFDEDGVPDLINGYAGADGGIISLHRGNIDSIYPNSPDSQRRKTSGQFASSPLLSPAKVFDVPHPTDFLAAGDFDADGHFDLVLNRHGGLNIPEIARVLILEGTLLTQQVHGQTLRDLLTLFGATPQWPDATPQRYLPLIAGAGLTLVKMREHWGKMTFTDVGAIIYYLHAIPWLVPDFSVATHLQPLRELQAQVERGEPLQFTSGAYLIEARKPTG